MALPIILKSRNHNIVEMLFLSCDEGDEFTTDSSIPTYQLTYAYWKYVSVRYYPEYKPAHWEIDIDWIVRGHRVKGVQKFGIATRKI